MVDDFSRPVFSFSLFFFSFSSSNGTIERGMKFYEKEWRAKEAERERKKESWTNIREPPYERLCSFDNELSGCVSFGY